MIPTLVYLVSFILIHLSIARLDNKNKEWLDKNRQQLNPFEEDAPIHFKGYLIYRGLLVCIKYVGSIVYVAWVGGKFF